MSKSRILPHSIEAEQAVLGCVLIDENEAQINILDQLKENDFYSGAHRTIFNAMYQLYRENKPVDFITLTSKLEEFKSLNDVGGLNYITTLSNVVPSAANYNNYLDIVSKNSVLRKLIKVSEQIIENSFDSNNQKEALAFAEKSIFDVGSDETSDGLTSIDFAEVLDDYDEKLRNPEKFNGIQTGFYALDKLIHGLNKGNLYVIGARPGMGKSAFVFNISTNIAVSGEKVAIFSLEMPKRQLAERMICGLARVDMGKYKSQSLSFKEIEAMNEANMKISNAGIFADDGSFNTPMSILSKCRKLKREKGLDLVVIDYLQLMGNGKNKSENRQQEVSEMSRMLKVMARELDVPVLLLSQLSRTCETRHNKRPLLSDLRESGAIEQDADVVMFIYRDDYYYPENKTNIAEIIVAKNRHGQLNTAHLGFKADSTLFLNLNRDSDKQSLEENYG